MRWLASITDSMDMNLSKLQEIVEVRGGNNIQNYTKKNLHDPDITRV